MQQSLFVVDTQNLFYSVRDLYGPGARIDFKKLSDKVKQLCGPQLRCIAYLGHMKDELRSLVAALKKLGYQIQNKPTITPRGDEEIPVLDQLVDAWKQYNLVCVASGDGDFIPLYDELRKTGTRVVVLAFSNALNTELLKRADQVLMLDELMLFKTPEATEEEEPTIEPPTL